VGRIQEIIDFHKERIAPKWRVLISVVFGIFMVIYAASIAAN